MPTPRRRWTEESIAQELAPVVEELGRLPTRTELTKRGLGGLWSAMQRRGGIDQFATLLPAPSGSPAAVADGPHADPSGAPEGVPVATADAQPKVEPRFTRDPTHEEISERAYFISQERGGDPHENWLAAEAELRGR